MIDWKSTWNSVLFFFVLMDDSNIQTTFYSNGVPFKYTLKAVTNSESLSSLISSFFWSIYKYSFQRKKFHQITIRTHKHSHTYIHAHPLKVRLTGNCFLVFYNFYFDVSEEEERNRHIEKVSQGFIIRYYVIFG